ncbi:hypothetical protein PHLCEN_2v7312 [Hermanssonia centrifuga]|uniref:Uncharacterized protein n=1 Tax=Hermanssonia centrifuga TaxID=98765 RepID=A0A2R6NWX5_9APHY|nr:hypothetical protein PHLCEN_2v7312 [Hermanssonia centrifuga]
MIIALIALLSLLASSPATSLPSDAHPLVKRFDDAQFIRHDTTGVLACGDLPHSEDEITNARPFSSSSSSSSSSSGPPPPASLHKSTQSPFFSPLDFLPLVLTFCFVQLVAVSPECSDCEDTGLGMNPNFFGSFEDYDPSVQALNGSWAFERLMPRRA